MVLEKTLENPLDCKEIQPVHPKGDQSWVFIGRSDVEAETPVLWPPDAKSWLIWKDPDAGKNWGQEETGTTDGWMASPTKWTWVWVNSRSWWWTGRPGMLWLTGCKELDTTEWLNWTEHKGEIKTFSDIQKLTGISISKLTRNTGSPWSKKKITPDGNLNLHKWMKTIRNGEYVGKYKRLFFLEKKTHSLKIIA